MSLRLHVSVNSHHISTAVHLETYQQQGLSQIFGDQRFTIYELSRGLRPAFAGSNPLIEEKTVYMQEICYLPSPLLTAKAPENGGPLEKEIPNWFHHHFQGLSGFQVPTKKNSPKTNHPPAPSCFFSIWSLLIGQRIHCWNLGQKDQDVLEGPWSIDISAASSYTCEWSRTKDLAWQTCEPRKKKDLITFHRILVGL